MFFLIRYDMLSHMHVIPSAISFAAAGVWV